MRGCALNQCLNFSSSEVFSHPGEFFDLAVRAQEVIVPEILGVDAKDLLPAFSVGQVDFDVDFEPSRSQHGLI